MQLHGAAGKGREQQDPAGAGAVLQTKAKERQLSHLSPLPALDCFHLCPWALWALGAQRHRADSLVTCPKAETETEGTGLSYQSSLPSRESASSRDCCGSGEAEPLCLCPGSGSSGRSARVASGEVPVRREGRSGLSCSPGRALAMEPLQPHLPDGVP